MTQTAPVSKAMLWAGRIVSAMPVLMLLASGGMKLAKPDFVLKSFDHLGYPRHLVFVIAALEIGSAIVYLIPRTAVLGAILMTGYLGGAIATHVRLAEPVFIQVGLGVLVWLGLFLRDRRLRELIPLRS